MEEQLITFETALLANDKGFKNTSRRRFLYSLDTKRSFFALGEGYDMGVSIDAPTQSLLQKWLREIHQIHLDSAVTFNRDYGFIGYVGNNPQAQFVTDDGTYEKALELGLKESLKLLKNLKK